MRVLMEMREVGHMDFRIIENETGIHIEYLIDAGRGPRYWERASTHEKSESGYRAAVREAAGILEDTSESIDYIGGDATLHRPLDCGHDKIKILEGRAYRLNDRGETEWVMIERTGLYDESMWSVIDDWSKVPDDAIKFFLDTELLGVEDNQQLQELYKERLWGGLWG